MPLGLGAMLALFRPDSKSGLLNLTQPNPSTEG